MKSVTIGLLLSMLCAPLFAQTDNAPGRDSNSEPVQQSVTQHNHDSGHGMMFRPTGMVMNENVSRLPAGCNEISGEHSFEVRVGTAYAEDFPGTVFGMSIHEIQVPPCALVTVILINEDQVRHQWMLHGLPRYLYPQGMFHLEAAGGSRQGGSFIVPPEDRTYLVHCDMTQHMEKGMKGQLVVGSGSGNLWAIPGVSADFKVPPFDFRYGISIVMSMAAMSFLMFAFIKERK